MKALHRPWPLALTIGLAAWVLFAWRLTVPHRLVFDEVHYVPAARALIALSGPVNIEHPLLGKSLIALGMLMFGDGPLGWRAMSTLAGAATVAEVFAIAWLLFRRRRPAVVASLLVMLNMTVFIQARIAMLDGFLAPLVAGAVAAMLWAMRGRGVQVQRRWLLGAVLLGLAVGVKWTAVPYVAGAGAVFLVARRGHPERWQGLHPVTALLMLGGASGLAYLLTFAPAFFYAREPLTLTTLLPFQLTMLAEQTQVLKPHPNQSSWWSWPLDLRPIWYLYEPADGAQRGILMLGNPAVMWGGLVAVAVCLGAGLRGKRPALTGVALLWIGSWLMWAVIPKSLGFIYYYYLSSIWLPLCLAGAFDHYGRRRSWSWDEAMLGLTALIFLHFYPIIAATALSGPGAFQQWMWLPSWP